LSGGGLHLRPTGTPGAANLDPIADLAASTPATGPFVPETVLRTLSLVNGTSGPGNVLFPNGSNPGALLYDGTNRTVYVAETGSHRLGEVNASSGRLRSSVPLGGSPGESPAGLALYTAGQRVFIAEGGGTNITVLSTGTNRVIGTIPVGVDPRSAAVVSAAAKLYVANFGSDNLTVINPFTSTQLGSVPTGHHPSATLFDVPGQLLLVANRGSNTVTVIDPFNASNDTTLSVGSQPDALAVDPVTNQLLVANYGDNDLSVFNATTLAPIGRFEVGPGPVAVAASWTGFSYTANALGNNITVYNDSSRRSVSDLALAGPPSAIINDPLNGEVYASVPIIDSLVLVSDGNHRINGTVPIGARPSGVAYDTRDDRYFVAVPDLQSVAVVNASSGALLGRIPVSAPPSHVLYLPSPGRIFVTLDPGSGANGSVAVIDPMLSTVLDTIAVGAAPQGLAVESSGPDLFVADSAGGQLSIIDLNTYAVVANVSLPRGAGNQTSSPLEIAVDSHRNRLFISEGISSRRVDVVDASNRSPIGSVGNFSFADGICYVPNLDEVWIADAGSNRISVVNGTSVSEVANISVGAHPNALAYVGATGLVYVADAGPNSVSLVTAATRIIEQTLLVGAVPAALAVDSKNANVSVANTGQGTLSFLGVLNDTTSFAVNFTEVGLPLIGLWTVTYGGVEYDSYASWLIIESRNGTYAYTVQTALALRPTPAGGNLTVDGANRTVAIQFLAQLYDARFTESGLPNGTTWWVSLNGTNSSSNGPTIDIAASNGTLPFVAGTGAPFVAPIASGSVVIDGGNTSTSIQFVPLPPYRVEFDRTGLVNATEWSVNLSGVELRSNQSTLTFREFNGTFGFAIGPVGGLRPLPASGVVLVNGSSPAPVAVRFVPMQFAIVFTESGLPPTTVWTMVLGGVSRSSPNSSIQFNEPNGSFAFSVGGLTAFRPSPPNGTLDVAGRSVQLEINFTGSGTGDSALGSWLSVDLLAGIVVAGILAVVGVAVLLRRRRQPPESGELPPASDEGPPPWDPEDPTMAPTDEYQELPSGTAR
jgi:YVTN family beta-propeller protein